MTMRAAPNAELLCAEAAQSTALVARHVKKMVALQQTHLPAGELQLQLQVDDNAQHNLQQFGQRSLAMEAFEQTANRRLLRTAQDKTRHVIASRFGAELEEDEDDETNRMRIEMLLMDQEWDTRSWDHVKIRAAIDALYSEIENSDSPERRELATNMLRRLLETHEDAVEYVESTLQMLMDKSFRNLTRQINKDKVFRVARLVASLAQWFPDELSRQNATIKCVFLLLRELDICARILQHHWRGVLANRQQQNREIDPVVKLRLRAMYSIKLLELRSQFKSIRDGLGIGGLPLLAIEAYVTILKHLVLNSQPMYGSADKNKLIASGALVYLGSLMTCCKGEIGEAVKIIIQQLCGQCELKIVDIVQCNVTRRVANEVAEQLNRTPVGHHYPWEALKDLDRAREVHPATLQSSLDVLQAISQALHTAILLNQAELKAATTIRNVGSMKSAISEQLLIQKRVREAARCGVHTPIVLETLLRCLYLHPLPKSQLTVLQILRTLACSFGFAPLLEVLTQCSGRYNEKLILCLASEDQEVACACLDLVNTLTTRQEAREGLTQVGAIALFAKNCSKPIHVVENKFLYCLSLIGICLHARQLPMAPAIAGKEEAFEPPTAILLKSTETALEFLYQTLLALVSDGSRLCNKVAMYLLSVQALPLLLGLLIQCSTIRHSESRYQSRAQRNISCIVLSRLFKTLEVADACFSEDTVEHLLLCIQSNRLDETERKVAGMTHHERILHQTSSMEACKALTRLARCRCFPVTLRPTARKLAVPEIPPAFICEIAFRLHVVQDITAFMRFPDESADPFDLELQQIAAAIEEAGYLRPLPFTEESRNAFASNKGAQLEYAEARLLQLIQIVVPVILLMLRHKDLPPVLVDACCGTLARLATTPSATLLLLELGTFAIALLHLPDILINKNSFVDMSMERSHSRVKMIPLDQAKVEERRLLEIPVSLFSLIARLCAVPEGKAEVLKSQVLPRLLKRLHLTNTDYKQTDDLCKGEIAVIIHHMAVVNGPEGNASEIFAFCKVLPVLFTLVKHNIDDVVSGRRSKRVQLVQRVLQALDALCQDVMTNVPVVVSADIVSSLRPLFTAKCTDLIKNERAPHLKALQYHAVSITRAIALYPLGEFHRHLTELHVLDDIQKIGSDFQIELSAAYQRSLGQKSVGDLARDIIAFINEHKAQKSPLGIGQQGQRARTPLSAGQSVKQPHHDDFPPVSPVQKSPLRGHGVPGNTVVPPKSEVIIHPRPLATLPLPQPVESSEQAPPVTTATLTPCRQQPEATSAPVYYTFARPKRVHHGKKPFDPKDMMRFLMLDPLFSGTRSPTLLRDESGPRQQSNKWQPFRSDVERLGNYVTLKARRQRQGDRYLEARGIIEYEEPPKV